MKKVRPRDHVIIGVHVTDRVRHAGAVQQALTEHGCRIKTRIGLHEVSNDYCSPEGIILLEAVGPAKEIAALTRALARIEGVKVQRMVFKH